MGGKDLNMAASLPAETLIKIRKKADITAVLGNDRKLKHFTFTRKTSKKTKTDKFKISNVINQIDDWVFLELSGASWRTTMSNRWFKLESDTPFWNYLRDHCPNIKLRNIRSTMNRGKKPKGRRDQ